jgi:hypothetical protein
MSDYNGWTNRNTWLINLHFGDLLNGYKEDGLEVTADLIKEIWLDHIELETKHLDATVMDFLDFEGINWEEIAEHYQVKEDE